MAEASGVGVVVEVRPGVVSVDAGRHGDRLSPDTPRGRNLTSSDGFGVGTAPVGSFLPNAFGVYDTIGNVWEWLEDCWNESYLGAPVNGAGWSTGDCSNRGTRGESWLNDPRFLRSAHQNRLFRVYRKYNTGFRVARSLSD